ncbi:MAG: hypothetical protein AAF192_17845 [Pseudomonadota bacterium]
MSAALRYAVYLALLALAGFVVYALVADLPPPAQRVVLPAPAPGG